MSIDTDTDGGCMHSKVISEGNGSGELGGQQQKSYDTEDGKRLSTSVRHSKHGETRTGSEEQIGDNQRREDRDMEMLQDDTVTEKPLHGGEHDIDGDELETGKKMRKEKSEHHESKKDDHLVMNTKGESGKAEKEGGEAEKGESEDLFPTVVETQISDIPHTEHASCEKMDSENTIADKGSDRSDNESKKVSRDEAENDKSGQETKMATVGGGAEEGDGRVEEGKAGHTECPMIHIKPFKKSAQRHYRDNKKVSDTDSGEMDAESRRSRKHMDSGKRQRRKSGDRIGSVDRGSRGGSSESRSRTKHMDNVCRSNKVLYERPARDTGETRHDIRRDSIDCERSRKRKRDRSRNSGKCSDVRTSHWKESESSKKDKDMPRKDREASEDDMVRKDSLSSKDKDKDSKDSHDRKVIRGDNSDAREGETPKEHKQRKQNNDNCTSKAQKKKKKKKKAQEINEKRNKKKAQRKEMREQRKALQRKRSRSGGQGHDDQGEG
ncbi:nuclear speckle splicing regulatory protein 1-like [Haliotis rubra]|uniref:nuclear speckle splicing regulatory protein 1-like n=1 Tax=Haliotis rubra TaxID=36100 RepID=UPI001EE5D9B4|nr:nuclear speckle splicing regulatory protein 1-like [Haliotis rubra]